MNNNLKKIIFIILLFLLLASPVAAQEINYPDFPGVQTPQEFSETAAEEDIPGLWVKYIIALATWSSGIIAVLALVIAGIKLLISTGNPDKITNARKQISSAVLGLLIIFTAYFVLETISPYFIDFSMPSIRNFSLADVPAPPSKTAQPSSIDTYIPFGRIIENIFQTYISNPEEAEITEEGPVVPEEFTRIQRINNTLYATEQLLPTISELVNEINDLSEECECFNNTDPDPECPTCSPPYFWPTHCTSDPCSEVRDEIVETEQELNPYLFFTEDGGEGVEEIEQLDVFGEPFTITTNLTQETTKLEQEISLLKNWFERLARAQKFIESCDWVALNNRNTFLEKKDDFEAKGWTIESVAFYDDLETILNIPRTANTLEGRWFPPPGTPLVTVPDESTLYCAVGGTYVRQPSDFRLGLAPPNPLAGIGESELEDYLENEELFTYEMDCNVTIPFGEILDKAHRLARMLINNLDLILDREKRIIEDSGEIQRLASQISSKTCCARMCVPQTSSSPCVDLGCVMVDLDTPPLDCPIDDIEDIAEDVTGYVAEIQTAATAVRRIFDLAPDLLQGMQNSLREHMTQCTFEKEMGVDVEFYTCEKALGATNEMGKLIAQCDAGTNQQWQDTSPYGGCLNDCMFKRISQTPSLNPTIFFGETDYTFCVSECMASYCIYNYNHELNFQCCHYEL